MNHKIRIIAFVAALIAVKHDLNAQWMPAADLMVGTFTAFAADSQQNVFGVSNDKIYLNDSPEPGFTDANVLISGTEFPDQSYTLLSTWSKGVFKTHGNLAWQPAGSGLTKNPIRAFAILPGKFSGISVYAGSEGSGVYVSNDNAASWSPSNIGIESFNISALGGKASTLLAGTEQGMYRSNDRGATWQQVNTGMTVPNRKVFLSDINSIVTSGNNFLIGLSKYKYPGTFDVSGVYLSTDDGQSWISLNNGLIDTNVNALAVVGNKLFAATNSGVFVSTNNGASWSLSNHNLPAEPVYCLFYHAGSLLVGSRAGLYESLDLGNSWGHHSVKSGSGAYEISTLTASGSSLFAGTSYYDSNSDSAHGVYRSTDEGGSWEAVNNGLPQHSVTTGFAAIGSKIICASAGNSPHWEVSAGGGLFESTDDGGSWQRVHNWPRQDSLTGVIGVIQGVLFVSGSRSTDNGVTWQPSGFNSNSGSQTSFASAGSVSFAGGPTLNGFPLTNALYRSTDSGYSWTAYDTIYADDVTAIGNTVYAAARFQGKYRNWSGIEFSTDRGNTWSRMDTTGLPFSFLNVGNLRVFSIGEHLFNGNHGLHMWNDTTSTWMDVSQGLYPNAGVGAVTVLGDKVFIVSSGSIWYRALIELIGRSRLAVLPSVKHELRLSPNPTTGIISVHNSSANILHVTVSSILGESILELEHPNAPEFTLDLSKLPPGTYFARFSLPNEVVTRKILKE